MKYKSYYCNDMTLEGMVRRASNYFLADYYYAHSHFRIALFISGRQRKKVVTRRRAIGAHDRLQLLHMNQDTTEEGLYDHSVLLDLWIKMRIGRNWRLL